MAAKPRVGIIGQGNVGSALGQSLSKAGYQVETTGNDPKHVREVAKNAEVVVMAVPYNERENAVREAGDLKGKVVVDVTDAVDDQQDFAASTKKAGAEELQEFAKGANVVKAFNTVFADHMKAGKVDGENLTLFAAGNDAAAKKRVLQMARDIGFETVDAGPLQNARWLETLGYLNMRLGYNQKLGPDAGFRYVHGSTGQAGGGPQ